GPRTPVRVVLCGSELLPRGSRLVQTARTTPLLLATLESDDTPEAQELRELGCEVIGLAGRNWSDAVLTLLDELGRRRLTNILVEGGSAVLGSFRDAGALDEVHVFIAPVLFGGTAALTAVGGSGVDRVTEALPLAEWRVERIDRDFLVHGWVKK